MKRDTSISLLRIKALREAIKQGISSGVDHGFNAKKHLAELKAQKIKKVKH